MSRNSVTKADSTNRLGTVGRIIVAVLVAYAVNGLLIAGTEQLLLLAFSGGRYLLADVATQCLIQLAAGYLCSRIAQSKRQPAIIGLVALGLLVGAVSVAASWRAEPHWYGLALLMVYAPCVWIGYRLDSYRLRRSAAAT